MPDIFNIIVSYTLIITYILAFFKMSNVTTIVTFVTIVVTNSTLQFLAASDMI